MLWNTLNIHFYLNNGFQLFIILHIPFCDINEDKIVQSEMKNKIKLSHYYTQTEKKCIEFKYYNILLSTVIKSTLILKASSLKFIKTLFSKTFVLNKMRLLTSFKTLKNNSAIKVISLENFKKLIIFINTAVTFSFGSLNHINLIKSKFLKINP